MCGVSFFNKLNNVMVDKLLSTILFNEQADKSKSAGRGINRNRQKSGNRQTVYSRQNKQQNWETE